MRKVIPPVKPSLRPRLQTPAEHDLHVRIAILEERLRGRDEALQLQAIEYERRLDLLNHAHEQATEKNNTFTSREMHDASVKAVEGRLSVIDIALAETRAEAKGKSSNMQMLISFAFSVGALVIAALSAWWQ